MSTTSNAVTTIPTVNDPDYSQFLFVKETINYNTTFKDALAFLASRQKVERTIPIASVAVETNGQITFGNTKYNCTKWAFEELCSRLGIPCPFARKIPADLLLDTITRLIKEASTGDDNNITFHMATVAPQQEIVIGCTKEDYQFVGQTDFVTAVAAMDGQGYKLLNLITGDRLIEADLTVDNQVITQTGVTYDVFINLRNSDCGDVNPTARLGLYNNQNQTSYILSTEWGRVDRLRNKKLTIQTSFENFMGKVVEMLIPLPQLTTATTNLGTDYVTDVGLKNYYSTFNRAIDDKSAIDNALGMNEEERKAIFKEITIRKKNNALNRLQGLPVVPDPSLNFTHYQLMNAASSYAVNAVHEEREALRRLSGSFIVLP